METAYWLFKTKQKFRQKKLLYCVERLFYELTIPFLVIILAFIYLIIPNKDKLCDYNIARFYRLVDKKNTLLKEGVIVWGYIIQANNVLFKPGNNPGIASIVYSFDPKFNNNISELYRIAQELYELKNKPIEHPELLDFKEIATAITNEKDTLINILIPNSVALNKLVYYTTIPVYRRDLPLNYLKSCWFPILAAPQKTSITRILPAKYWFSPMVQAWCDPKKDGS